MTATSASSRTVAPISGRATSIIFIVENPLESNVDYVNLGFRFDTLVGNDWQFSKSYGLFDRAFHDNTFGGVDLPQMYGSIHLPILTPLGMDVIGGRFYSPAGFESVMAVKRPLLSAPYFVQFHPIHALRSRQPCT